MEVRSHGEAVASLIAPRMFWHAAAIEQVRPRTMLDDPDAAARALASAVRLYGVDILVVAPVDAVAWAVRGPTMPGAALAVIEEAHRSRHELRTLPEDEEIQDSAAVRYVVGLVERLRAQLAGVARVAIAVPTGETLARSLGSHIHSTMADRAVGAFLREVGAAEPDLALRFGEGERGGPVVGISGFFGLPLIEITPEAAAPVADDEATPEGFEFVALGSTFGRMVTTTSELPADTSPVTAREAIETLRSDARSRTR